MSYLKLKQKFVLKNLNQAHKLSCEIEKSYIFLHLI